MAVSKFLEEKWRKGFRVLDINKDGYLSVEDFATVGEYIANKMQVSQEEKAEIKAVWVKWFYICNPEYSVRISEEKYVQGAANLNKHLDNHKRLVGTSYSATFDIIDLDKDGRLSYEELKIYYQEHGIKNEDFVRRVFNQMDADQNGFVDREEFIMAYVRFWTSSDESDEYSFVLDPPVG